MSNDNEWRNALKPHLQGKLAELLETGTPAEIVKGILEEYGNIQWQWREEIEKYLPQMAVMSFFGPESTIRWLMEQVTIKPECEAQEWKKSLERIKERIAMGLISSDDFANVELRVGTIQEAVPHPNADKLMVLQVDLGKLGTRQIVAGIKQHYDPDSLKNKQIVVVVNLEPRELRGVKSEGMLLAAKENEKLVLLTSDSEIGSGSKIG